VRSGAALFRARADLQAPCLTPAPAEALPAPSAVHPMRLLPLTPV